MANFRAAVRRGDGASVQRAGEFGTGAASGAEGAFRQRNHVGLGDFSDRQHCGTGGGGRAVHSASAWAAAWREPGVFIFAGGDCVVSGAGWVVARAAWAHGAPVSLERCSFGWIALCGWNAGAVGVDFVGSFRSAAGWGGCVDADFRAGDSACWAAGSRDAARGAGCRSADRLAVADGAADPEESRRENADLRGDLWRGHGVVRAVAEPAAFSGSFVHRWRLGHDQRCYSVFGAATGDAAGDAWARERGQFAVYRGIERAG